MYQTAIEHEHRCAEHKHGAQAQEPFSIPFSDVLK
jgi:hypothetical protein